MPAENLDHSPAPIRRRFHSIAYVMDVLGCSRQHIYNLHKRQMLRISKLAGKTGVFDEDLEELIARSKEQSPQPRSRSEDDQVAA